MAKIANFYDGSVTTAEVINDSSKIAGHYMQIDLHSPNLQQRYGTRLELPASVCAYAAWHQLSPAKRAQTSFFRVTLHSASSKLTYTIPTADVALAASSGKNLVILINNLRNHHIATIANSFTTESLHNYPADSLQQRLARVANKLAPLPSYDLEGFTMLDDTSALGRPPLVRFLVSIHHPSSQAIYLLSASFVSGTTENKRIINDMHLTD
jgi:hypothetical protein